MMSVDQVIAVARENADHELLTIGAGAPFACRVDGGVMVFQPVFDARTARVDKRARLWDRPVLGKEWAKVL